MDNILANIAYHRLNKQWKFSMLLIMLNIYYNSYSQEIQFSSIDPIVISSSGMNITNDDGMSLFYTVGDLAIKHVRDGVKLSEGFHHTFFIITDTDELTYEQLTIFPNPTNSSITIHNPNKTVQYRLFDNIG